MDMYFERNIGYHLRILRSSSTIVLKPANYHDCDWRQQLAGAFNDMESLCRHLNISADDIGLDNELKFFPMKVPRSFVDRMERGNPDDPLLRQILPVRDELSVAPGYTLDPVGDIAAIAEAGIIHKYRGRALLVTTGACAINCRYCFRRNFPYADVQLTSQRQSRALAYLHSHPEISEIILSGGDPLLLSDEKLSALFEQLDNIPHLQRIRIHSRLPVVLPARITPALLNLLSGSRKQVVLVIHANHSRELSGPVSDSCRRLRDNGITLLNQSVLLQAVNDSASALCQLSERLFTIGVLPYYLHLLDKAHGTAHFEVGERRARELMEQVKTQLPGYLVPKLVKEVAGAASKLTIC